MSRKSSRKRKRGKRNITGLFFGVFVGVLAAGALILAGLYFVHKQADSPFASNQNPASGATESGTLEAAEQPVSASPESGPLEAAEQPAPDSPEAEWPGEAGEPAPGMDSGDDAKSGISSVSGSAGGGRFDDLLADPEYMQAYRIYQKDTSSENEVSLLFAGDILLAESYAPIGRIRSCGGNIADRFSPDIYDLMMDADIFMVNNEFPYSDSGSPLPEKQFTFRAKPESAGMLYDMGVDIVSLANNHAYDYGESAFLDTLDTLEDIRMPYVGAGRNLSEATRPVYFIANDLLIAYISATQIERLDYPDTPGAGEDTPGVARCFTDTEMDNVLTQIERASKECDFVVVYVHWGTENTEMIDWAQEKQAPLFAEAGADLIIGDHPHCLQGIAYEGDTPVFYSLGNYLFNSKDLDTCLVQAVIDADGLKSLQFIPCRQQNCSVFLQEGEEKERVLAYMRDLSPGVSVDAQGYVVKMAR